MLLAVGLLLCQTQSTGQEARHTTHLSESIKTRAGQLTVELTIRGIELSDNIRIGSEVKRRRTKLNGVPVYGMGVPWGAVEQIGRAHV